jgi:Reverse transcriptase (RNA-dependent DNA polymerase)
VWNEFLLDGLKEIGFVQRQNDRCLLWRQSCIIVIYTDNTIAAAIDKELMNKAIKDIGNKFSMTTSLSVEDFLGVHIAFDEQGALVEFTQSQLIKSIISDLGLDDKSNAVRPHLLEK